MIDTFPTISQIIAKIIFLILTIMTHRKSPTQTPPSILALKSIIAKVRDDICMRSLTVAIRQHCLEQQQTHLKEQFLSFFLTCQSKIKRNSSQQWNRVIDSEIKKIVGTDKLNAFLNLKIYRESFKIISAYSQMDEKTKIEEKIYEEFQDLRELQISDEVKTKTKYFFYWCRFLSEKKQIKQLKNKQIQDLKKAKIFGQYSSKFQTFMHWKQYVRRLKLTKQKAIGLEEKSKRSKLAVIFAQIKQKVEIIEIEKKLQEVVTSKLRDMCLHNVFGNLKKHKQKQQNTKASLKRKQNIWLYRFFNFLSQRGTSQLNKASVLARQKTNFQYDRTCKKMCWKGLKKRLQLTHEQIKKVQYQLKKNGISSFARIVTQQKQTRIKNKLITSSFKKYLFTLFCNAAEQSTEHHQFLQNQIQQTKKHIMQNVIKNALLSMKIYKENQDILTSNITKFKSKINSQVKSSLIRRLKKIKNYKKELCHKIEELSNINAIQLLQYRFKSYTTWKREKRDMHQLFADKHNTILTRVAFKGFQSYKKAKTGQLQTLNCVFKLIDTRMKSDTFEYLKRRTIQIKKIEKLIEKCEYIALKVSFITILNKMLSKKMKIKSFCGKQDLKLKRMLFDMLITNSEHLQTCSDQANLICIKLTKKEFINKLKQDLVSQQKQKQVIQMIEMKQKFALFHALENRKKNQLLHQQNAYKIGIMVKNSRLQQFQQSVSQFISYRKEQTRKMIKTENVVIRGYIRTMREFLKFKKEKYQAEKQLNSYHNSLIKQIQNKQKSLTLQNLVRFTDSALTTKSNQLYQGKFKELLKFLKFNCSNSKLKKYNWTSKAEQILYILKKKVQLKKKRLKLKKYIFAETTARSLTLIDQNLKFQAQERQQKTQMLSAYLLQKRDEAVKTSLISNLKRHHQLKQNTQSLVNQIARFGFKQLVQSYLVTKSNQMKEYVAIRHYANNVKRRGMRGIKYSMNVSLLKENRTKTEFNSKILMERSLDNVRKKSKLLETIERYNMSRVSRVIR